MAHLVAGGDVWYHIQPGDTVAALASRFGVDGDGLAQRAHLYPRLDANLYTRPLPVGSALEIDNHYIVPADLKNGILVSIAQFGQWLHAFSFGTLKTLFEVSIHSTGRQ